MNIKQIAKKILALPKRSQESEIGSGVFEERRLMLWAPAIAFAGLVFGIPQRSLAETVVNPNVNTAESSEIGFDEFFRESSKLIKETYAATNPNEDAHIFRLSQLVSRLRLDEVPKGRTGKFAGLNPPVEIGPVKIDIPISIIQWRLAPGATFPAHNHQPCDVISVCLEGETLVRHFENEGPAQIIRPRRHF